MRVNLTETSKSVKKGGTKRIVGLIAIALIVVVTILAVSGVLSFLEWILAEIMIALIANIIFRVIDKRGKQ